VREAADAETLMRSRYSAFAAGEIDYLVRTLHPDHDDRELSDDALREVLRRSARTHKYMGLTILDTEPADAQGIARVLFFAKVFEQGANRSFGELSSFAHDGTGWRYLSGTARPAPKSPGDMATMRIGNFA
jgi:SEC-C motif-containing protein